MINNEASTNCKDILNLKLHFHTNTLGRNLHHQIFLKSINTKNPFRIVNNGFKKINVVLFIGEKKGNIRKLSFWKMNFYRADLIDIRY